MQQLGARDRRRTALHDHNSSGVVGEVRRFVVLAPGSQRGGEGCNHGVPSARDIRDFIAAERGNVHGLVPRKRDHAIAAACNDQRLQLQAPHTCVASVHEFAPILAHAKPQCLLDLASFGVAAVIPENSSSR